MTYLEEVQTQILQRNFTKFLVLWEEYCASDQVDVAEFLAILKAIKTSDFAKSFGKMVETALPLWEKISDKTDRYEVLKSLIDLQTTNTSLLADLAYKALQDKHGSDSQFAERLRMVGLRTRDQFQGALSHYDLLTHMLKGNFVFHSGGWGAGEIMDVSPIRQQITVEFEHVQGIKHITFENAFKTLIPLKAEHFLVRRFGFPDALEQEAREDPVKVIKLLLRDLGPKTAGEIKDELCDLVIPDEEWSKWWQATRAKLKKDALIDSPEALKDVFRLRATEISQEEIVHRAIHDKTDVDEIIHAAYQLLRDTKQKNVQVRDTMKEKLLAQLSHAEITPEQELQICMCLESYFEHEIKGKELKELILRMENLEHAISIIEIVALKKRVLTLIKEWRKDWEKLFLHFLVSLKHSALRDYLYKELNQFGDKKQIDRLLEKMLHHPEQHPDFFLWYFQKALDNENSDLLFSNKSGICKLFEAFFVLMHRLENREENKDFVKKLYLLLSGKRYELVRKIMDGASLEDVKEFLLLASKCQTLSDHDIKILHSLAAVVHPSLDKKGPKEADNVIWTTEEGYLRMQDRAKHIGTIEIIQTAKEIEAARALGDLRENSEYKFAQEKRSRLQSELKMLSEQLNRARIITKDDITPGEVSPGSIVEVVDANGKKTGYTILGPWDADPDNNVLSFQSQLAQAMVGHKKGDKFTFRDETFLIADVKSFLK